MNNLRRIDLNLLVTLHALLMEKHVSKAALRLHKSQPAVSHSLARLRELFDDPLLIRRSGKLELTSRASALLQPLIDSLEQLGSLLDPPQFDPTRARRVFRLTMSDYGARVLLPKLVHSLRTIAPGIDLEVDQTSRRTMLANVIDGDTDMVLGVFPEPHPEGLSMQTLFTERFACLADSSTLPMNGALDLDAWLQRPHVLVAMSSSFDDEIGHALARAGLSRRIAVTLPHWGIANQLIAGTNLVLTVARRNLEEATLDPRLRVFEPPLAIEPFEFKLVWHQRKDTDPAHKWLRNMIIRVTEQN